MNNFWQLLPAWWTYFMVTASPGPSNMAIMTMSMERGRRPALALACGVIAGSQFWGLSAAVGVSSLIVSRPRLLHIISIVGGAYFIWLCYKCFRSIFTVRDGGTSTAPGIFPGFWRLFARGFSFHIVNPKAILGWISIIAIAVTGSDHGSTAFIVVAGCLFLGLAIFGFYAIAFSTPMMISFYLNQGGRVNAVVGAAFFYVGVELLLSGLRSL